MRSAVLLDFYGTLAHATGWVSIDVVLAEHGYELPTEVRERWWFESEQRRHGARRALP